MNTRLMIEATKANKAGDCHIYVEVSVSRLGEKKKTVRIPTNIKVKADSWSAKSQSVIRTKAKDYYKVNQMLNTQKELVTDIIAELSQKGRFQLSEIKQRYIEKTSPVTLGFFDIFDEIKIICRFLVVWIQFDRFFKFSDGFKKKMAALNDVDNPHFIPVVSKVFPLPGKTENTFLV